jgi:hypothetical protein
MNEELTRMLKLPDKGASEASGVLSKLWRGILVDLDVTHYTWGSLMLRYLNDPRNGIPRDVKDKSSARGNLNKELKRPRMTWKVFLKGLRFLGPVRIEFVVKLTWKTRTTTVHRLQLDNGWVGCDDEVDEGAEDDVPGVLRDETEMTVSPVNVMGMEALKQSADHELVKLHPARVLTEAERIVAAVKRKNGSQQQQ